MWSWVRIDEEVIERAVFHILYGTDDFSLREEMERIKAGLGDGESLASNTTLFDGQRLGLNQLMDACMALPFLGTHRLVVVQGLLARFDRRESGPGGQGEGGANASRGSAASKEWSALKERVAGLPPTTVLVLVDVQISKGNALLKKLAPLAEVREFPSLKGAALRQWIERRVKQEGGSISPEAVRLLASLVGENLWVLASEIDKLISYTLQQAIDVEDVEAVVSYAREGNVFAMVDALLERRASTAASLLHQLLQEGAPAPYLIFMVTRQLRMLVQVKELDLEGLPNSQIKSVLGVTSDYVFGKAVEQAKRYSMRRLGQVYHSLLETDLSIKRGVHGGELALDLLVAELCG